MGIQISGQRDVAPRLAAASLTIANQVCGPVEINGPFLVLANTADAVGATLTLEMSVDGGTSWVLPQDASGNPLLDNVAPPINRIIGYQRLEDGLLWRLRLAAITSGTVTARLSSGGAA